MGFCDAIRFDGKMMLICGRPVWAKCETVAEGAALFMAAGRAKTCKSLDKSIEAMQMCVEKEKKETKESREEEVEDDRDGEKEEEEEEEEEGAFVFCFFFKNSRVLVRP